MNTHKHTIESATTQGVAINKKLFAWQASHAKLPSYRILTKESIFCLNNSDRFKKLPTFPKKQTSSDF